MGVCPAKQVGYMRVAGTSGHEAFLIAIHTCMVPMYLRPPPNKSLGSHEVAMDTVLYPVPTYPPSDRPCARVIDLELAINMKALAARMPKMFVFRKDLDGNPVQYLCSDFISEENRVVSITVVEGGDVAHTGCMFQNCSNLLRLDLSDMSALSSLGPYSMMECTVLEEVLLPTFLPAASRPKSAQLPPHHDIGVSMLASCPQLRVLDLHPIRHVVSIGGAFCQGCIRLTSIDMSPLESLESIGDGFLAGCVSLGAVVCKAPLPCLEYIGSSFLGRCSRLRSIPDLPCILSNVKSLDYNFMTCCTGLQSISFSSDAAPDGCPALTSISGNFIDKCSSLINMDLKGLHNVERLGSHAFSSCLALEHIDCTPLTSLKVVEKGFATLCRSLRTVDFSGLACVTTIQRDVCCRDPNTMPVLEMVDCRGMTALAMVHKTFAERDVLVHKDEGYPTP